MIRSRFWLKIKAGMRKKIVKIIFIYKAEVRINSFFSIVSKLLG